MVKKRLILQLQQKEIAALEEIIQTYHNYVAKILYLIFDYPHKHYTFKYFEV